MSFSGQSVKLGLALRIDLPNHDVRLSDGGEVVFNGDTYSPSDDVLGNIIEFQDFTTGEADEAPSFEVTWGLKDVTAAVALSQPSVQGSVVEWSILSINRETNAVLSSEPIFAGIVDSAAIEGDTRRFVLRMSFSTEIDRLINTDKGNKVNRAFHRFVWPNESGLDLMTGTTIPVPWGDKTPARRGGGGGGGGGGGQPSFNNRTFQR